MRCWYVIVFDAEEVGTIWLEKHAEDDDVVNLGIMLGSRENFEKGIGRAAIHLAITQARKQLSFRSVELNVRKANYRAIACYRSCGFGLVREGIKIDGDGNEMPYFTMKKDLK